MARTQKQVAEKYKGNLGYFKKPHYLRTLRLGLTTLTVGLVTLAILYHYERGSDQIYNPGPLSRQHAHLENNCASCHVDKRDLISRKIVSRELGLSGTSDILKTAVSATRDRLKGSQYQELDQGCLHCHSGYNLHRPDLAALALQNFKSEIHKVQTGSCTSCHFEHVGSGKMKMPGNESCVTCHGNLKQMLLSTHPMQLAGGRVPAEALVEPLDDGGVAHFITPESNPPSPRVFSSFEEGHPNFGYQLPGLRDPNAIRFNHQRHEAADIPRINGKKLDCASCHKPESDGVFYKPVAYESSCKGCHSLQFDPKNPDLQIPHGDPDKVRAFLRTLPFQYAQVAEKRGLRGQREITDFANQQLLALRDRVRSGEDFEKQIFYTANPYKEGRNPPQIAPSPGGTRAQFPGCAYCHNVTATPNGVPLVKPPVMADRWLERGEFTHAKHTHMSCAECHQTSQSRNTADILMPTKASCVECHRSRQITTVKEASLTKLSDQQRKNGGAPTDCLSCHTFHSPALSRQRSGLEAGSPMRTLLERNGAPTKASGGKLP